MKLKIIYQIKGFTIRFRVILITFIVTQFYLLYFNSYSNVVLVLALSVLFHSFVLELKELLIIIARDLIIYTRAVIKIDT